MLHAGQNIKTLRELRNFTQEYIATQLNMSVPNYSNIENGKTDITLTRLQQIAKVLQTDCTHILGLDPSHLFEESHPHYAIESAGNYCHEMAQQLRIKDEQINRLLALLEKNNQ